MPNTWQVWAGYLKGQIGREKNTDSEYSRDSTFPDVPS